MTIEEVKKYLKTSFQNGVYVDLPHFRSPESIYITKNGSLFHVWHSRNQDGSHFHKVQPTTLMSSELADTRWQIRNL